ncbi:MAG: hypothetical protein ACUVQI_08910 [Thermochromatium sp.]
MCSDSLVHAAANPSTSAIQIPVALGVLDTALCLNWPQTSTDPQTPLPDLTTSAEFMPLARQVLASSRPVRQTLGLERPLAHTGST